MITQKVLDNAVQRSRDMWFGFIVTNLGRVCADNERNRAIIEHTEQTIAYRAWKGVLIDCRD